MKIKYPAVKIAIAECAHVASVVVLHTGFKQNDSAQLVYRIANMLDVRSQMSLGHGARV